jgi:hypothetical protein
MNPRPSRTDTKILASGSRPQSGTHSRHRAENSVQPKSDSASVRKSAIKKRWRIVRNAENSRIGEEFQVQHLPPRIYGFKGILDCRDQAYSRASRKAVRRAYRRMRPPRGRVRCFTFQRSVADVKRQESQLRTIS